MYAFIDENVNKISLSRVIDILKSKLFKNIAEKYSSILLLSLLINNSVINKENKSETLKFIFNELKVFLSYIHFIIKIEHRIY